MAPGSRTKVASRQAFLAHAHAAAQAHGYELDAAQLHAGTELDRLYRELIRKNGQRSLLRRLWPREAPVCGVYLWGGVGRGKTFLMDVFFETIPLESKLRLHFHRFMQRVHHRLRDLQGEPNPLRIIGAELAGQAKLICLDEFHVTDIGDAMIMRLLLESLFAEGSVLVTTANLHPDALYEHGLQRARFLPAIDLIRRKMRVVKFESGTDYRLVSLEKAGVFHPVVDAASEQAMLTTFADVSGEPGACDSMIEVEGREILARRVSQNVAWFEFAEICDGPRSRNDYIELSKRFHTVLISGVPVFDADSDNARRRFTWLVDEFYDRRVKLVLSAHAGLPVLFEKALGGAEADRTSSRLIEMQARRYLGEAHLP
jgi:cell division protein ZapE